jgi:hypothetical protein
LFGWLTNFFKSLFGGGDNNGHQDPIVPVTPTPPVDPSDNNHNFSVLDPVNHSNWQIQYHASTQPGAFYLNPPAPPFGSPSAPGTTAAALVTSKFTCKDFIIEITAKTLSQLRQPNPNPFEVFWIFFNYVIAPNGKKEANYFILKPNGVEIGTAKDELGQIFLSTENNPKLVLGMDTRYKLIKRGQKLSVHINNNHVKDFDYSNNIPGKQLYNHNGKIGLYCEDAQVVVSTFNCIPIV